LELQRSSSFKKPPEDFLEGSWEGLPEAFGRNLPRKLSKSFP
jgi:hypothetical protein